MNPTSSHWNLRTKTLLAIGGVLLAMVLVLYFATNQILISSFSTVETSVTNRDVSRVTDALGDEIDSIVNFTGDYSDWDETVKFIKTGSQAYIDSNLLPATYENLKINHFAFLNTTPKLIVGKDYDLGNGKLLPISQDLVKHFKAGDSLLIHKDHDDIKKGFLILEGGPAMIASRPIMDSNGEGPIEGSVVTGRDFNQDEIQAVAAKTHLSFKVFELNGQNLPADVVAAKKELQTKSIYDAPKDHKTIYGYTILNDLYGKPLLITRVEVPREVYLQGLKARNYVVISLLSIGIAFLLMALVLITRIYHHDQEVQALKDRFIAIASHELRTPLTSLKGGVDLLKIAKLPPEVQSPLRIIEEGVGRLKELTDELINVVTIEKGQIKPQSELVNIGNLVTEVCQSDEAIAKARNISLSCDVAPNLPGLTVDPRLIRNAVHNLVNNAIKFTDKGSVAIKVYQTNDNLVIDVADTGPGIKGEDVHFLFKKFGRIGSLSEGFKEGKGLGLYLTKLNVEAHHGKIELKTSPNGSTFSILLPLPHVANQHTA